MNDYGTLRAMSALRRQRYNQEAMAKAEEADNAGQYNLAMFRPSVLTQHNLNAAESQADFNPSWDAYYEALQESTPNGSVPTLGGQLGNQGQSAFGSLKALRAATRK